MEAKNSAISLQNCGWGVGRIEVGAKESCIYSCDEESECKELNKIIYTMLTVLY